MSTKHSFTIIGEFFPEVYPTFRSEKWTRGEEDPLTTEMRFFSACLRWSYSGDRTKGGNPNLKITFDGHAFRMAVTISHLSEPTGVDALGRPIMRRAPASLAGSGFPRSTGRAFSCGLPKSGRTPWN